MIAFGTSITSPDAYRTYAEPGIRRAAEADSAIYPFSAAGSIYRSYNLLLDTAAQEDNLEALVLVHQDTEIVDDGFCAKVRAALADPDVGVVGCVGAIGVRSIAWWEGSVTWASFIHRYGEYGGGDLPSFSWVDAEKPPYARTGEVDTVDGFLLVLSPWVVRNLRFDESLGQLHGYDFDFCLQVREAGRKIATADLHAVHNHSLELVSDLEGWVEAHMRITEKWEGRMPGIGAGGEDWRLRARRAEAESEAARAVAVSKQLQSDARARQLEDWFEETTSSLSWKLTKPLRELNKMRREGLRRRNGGSA